MPLGARSSGMSANARSTDPSSRTHIATAPSRFPSRMSGPTTSSSTATGRGGWSTSSGPTNSSPTATSWSSSVPRIALVGRAIRA